MVKVTKSTKVPKARQGLYRELTALTDKFCLEHLNQEYGELARYAIAALCRKRPCPLLSGRPDSWACGVVYAIGQVNFLTDRSTEPYMAMADLCARFGVAPSTGASKAKTVRDLLGIKQWDHRWILTSSLESIGPLWLIEVDGLVVDARWLPRRLQQVAFEKGLIPYVPDDSAASDRDEVLARYRRYREINTDHQTFLAVQVLSGPVPGIAVRLGLVQTRDALAELDIDDMTLALDLALYSRDDEGVSEVQRYLAAKRADLEEDDGIVLEAMSGARFSLFEVLRRHPVAGVVLQDMLSGEEVWRMDEGLEASVPEGCRLALRLFRPADFWMTTGAAILLTADKVCEAMDQRHPVFGNDLSPSETSDLNAFAEAVYHSALRSEAMGQMALL